MKASDQQETWGVRYFQFFDDWLLDGHRDIRRGYGRPRLVHTIENLKNAQYASVEKTADGRYRLWYRASRPFAEEGESAADRPCVTGIETPGFIEGRRHGYALCYAESDDGLNFAPTEVPAKDPRFAGQHDVIDVPRSCWIEAGSTYVPLDVYLDPREPESDQRYKSLIQSGRLLTSPDGFHWTDTGTDTFQTHAHMGSDADNHLRYNPFTRRYQAAHRPGHWDRRVAISESAVDDVTRWGEPRVIFTPDVLDPPCHQFQGFPYYAYEDMWVGWLQHFDCSIEEKASRRKMNQQFHEELAYSYNGRHWQRSRHTFFEKPDPPAYGAGLTGSRGIMDEGDHLKIYSSGSIGFAGRDGPPKLRALDNGLDSERFLLVWQLRKDGFCYLEPKAGYALLWTRGLVPQDDDFTVNCLAPYGRVRLQLTDEEDRVLPGFSFENFGPLSGDVLAARPCWRSAQLSDVVGKWCRLEVELFDARLYAFRWNCKLAYTKRSAFERL